MCVEYDNTVRDSENAIIQFQFGDDGLDPMILEQSGIVPFDTLLEYVKMAIPTMTTPHSPITSLIRQPTQVQPRYIVSPTPSMSGLI